MTKKELKNKYGKYFSVSFSSARNEYDFTYTYFSDNDDQDEICNDFFDKYECVSISEENIESEMAVIIADIEKALN